MDSVAATINYKCNYNQQSKKQKKQNKKKPTDAQQSSRKAVLNFLTSSRRLVKLKLHSPEKNKSAVGQFFSYC